jgi:L-alanine-DL-glutamate epimerase-like enolase superfamily enzyme
VVRAYYFGWYQELVEDLPPLKDGFIAPLDAPGLGVRLRKGFRERADVHVQASGV